MHNVRQLVLSISLGLLVLVGCSTQTRTVKTETVQTTEPAPASAVVTKTETETIETRSEPQGGILSGTVDVVGKTLALPFRVVGGLIDLIF